MNCSLRGQNGEVGINSTCLHWPLKTCQLHVTGQLFVTKKLSGYKKLSCDLTSVSQEISWQGDQMSLRRSHPKSRPTNFLSKLMHNWYRGKSSRKNVRATSAIFKTLPTVNNRPLGEKVAQSGHLVSWPDSIRTLIRWLPRFHDQLLNIISKLLLLFIKYTISNSS
jgi:hypothetical protein